MMFSMAIDGSYALYWYCGYDQCVGDNPAQYNRICQQQGGVECKIFARGRYIKWKNGINKGKGKSSKINSQQSFREIKDQLTKLGFVGNDFSNNDTSSNTSVISDSSDDKSLVKQLETLTKMFKDGLISEEEFMAAKKKLLE